MKRSTERILTTHAGSLPRPADVLQLRQASSAGQPVDQQVYRTRLRSAVADIVRRQVDLGVDIVDDGEMSKPGFIHYVNERLSGFQPGPEAPTGSTWARSREVRSFPEFYDWFARALPSPGAAAGRGMAIDDRPAEVHRPLQHPAERSEAVLPSEGAARVGVRGPAHRRVIICCRSSRTARAPR